MKSSSVFLVGDSGVGKTCLVCAWACNAKYDLKSLVKSHAATVWATDHYRYDKEVCYFMGHYHKRCVATDNLI